MDDKMTKNGKTYQMGASINDLEAGDVVKVGRGQLEEIVRIERSGKWDYSITTASGKTYSMADIYSYGIKENKK